MTTNTSATRRNALTAIAALAGASAAISCLTVAGGLASIMRSAMSCLTSSNRSMDID